MLETHGLHFTSATSQWKEYASSPDPYLSLTAFDLTGLDMGCVSDGQNPSLRSKEFKVLTGKVSINVELFFGGRGLYWGFNSGPTP
jgi:hypothetical protein